MRVAVTVFVSQVPPARPYLTVALVDEMSVAQVDHHRRADEVGQIRVPLQLRVEGRRRALTAAPMPRPRRSPRSTPRSSLASSVASRLSLPPWLPAMPPVAGVLQPPYQRLLSDPTHGRAKKATPISRQYCPSCLVRPDSAMCTAAALVVLCGVVACGSSEPDRPQRVEPQRLTGAGAGDRHVRSRGHPRLLPAARAAPRRPQLASPARGRAAAGPRGRPRDRGACAPQAGGAIRARSDRRRAGRRHRRRSRGHQLLGPAGGGACARALTLSTISGGRLPPKLGGDRMPFRQLGSGRTERSRRVHIAAAVAALAVLLGVRGRGAGHAPVLGRRRTHHSRASDHRRRPGERLRDARQPAGQRLVRRARRGRGGQPGDPRRPGRPREPPPLAVLLRPADRLPARRRGVAGAGRVHRPGADAASRPRRGAPRRRCSRSSSTGRSAR